MGFKDLRLKFKAWLKGNSSANVKKPSWMKPISHGYFVFENRPWEGDRNGLEQADTVVVQREETCNLELWFYSLSDNRFSDSISNYMQSHLFGTKFNESQVSTKCKETVKKAYISAKAKLESATSEKATSIGSTSVVVIDGEKLVMAQMGGFRAILCRDGVAHQLRSKHRHTGKRRWPRRLISGVIRIPTMHIQACNPRRESSRKQDNNPELIIVTEKIDSETEFLILTSTGVLEVMGNQETVDLIRHIDDPQEAAECLAKEALTRMSRSNISCIVVRFD